MALRKQVVFVTSCIALCFSGLAGTLRQGRAAVYVVDAAAPGAADANPGTEEKPLKTVQRPADVAKPGDTVYVMASRYNERIRVKNSGAEGRPITFRSDAPPLGERGRLRPGCQFSFASRASRSRPASRQRPCDSAAAIVTCWTTTFTT